MSQQEIVLLLLGPTGVGKSTWINALVNYLKYGTLDKAKKNKVIVSIPAHFVKENEEFEFPATTGEKRQFKRPEIGESDTRDCSIYTVHMKKNVVKIIDTPGMGDTRGELQDAVNIKLILETLSQFEYINALCIMMNANEDEVPKSFPLYVKEILSYFDKTVHENMYFLFTHSSSRFFKLEHIENSVKYELENAKIKIMNLKEHFVALDNDPFKHLCILSKRTDKSTKTEKQRLQMCWQKSNDNSVKFLKGLFKFQAEKRINTAKLGVGLVNEARLSILSLVRPISDVIDNIDTNTALFQRKIQELEENDMIDYESIEELELIYESVNNPKTICTENKCVDRKDKTTNVCHTDCVLQGLAPETYPDERMKDCYIFEVGEACSICGCVWEKHTHVTYEIKTVHNKLVTPEHLEKLQNEQNPQEKKKIIFKILTERVENLRVEKRIIIKSSTTLAKFIKQNTNTPTNDPFLQYMSYKLKKLEESGAEVPDFLQKLYALSREQYERESQKVYKNIEEDSSRPITVSQVHDQCNILLELPISGRQLKNGRDVQMKAIKDAFLKKNKDISV